MASKLEKARQQATELRKERTTLILWATGGALAGYKLARMFGGTMFSKKLVGPFTQGFAIGGLTMYLGYKMPKSFPVKTGFVLMGAMFAVREWVESGSATLGKGTIMDDDPPDFKIN